LPRIDMIRFTGNRMPAPGLCISKQTYSDIQAMP
jgi:hypothetical protein